jgi:hypothetical protein
MATPEPQRSKDLGVPVTLFRVLGGVLLTLAVMGLVAVAIGAYFIWAEFPRSGWFAVVLLAGVGISAALMGVVGARALRIKSVEELEAQSKSTWIDL